MMANILPIRCQEVLQLSAVGINPQHCTFNTLTLESDKFICVRETTGEQASVAIVDLENPQAPVMRFPITAESAIMNPQQKILALKSGTTLQIFHIELRRKMKDYVMPEAISFWKWISPSTIGLVTASAVYHWSIEGTSAPTKVFDRHSNLNDSQIINYRTDSTQQWLVLIGIAQKEGRIAGSIQLYSVERAVSQSIEGHAAVFAKWQSPTASKPAILFAFTNRNATAAKLFILEVGESTGFQRRVMDVYFPPDAIGDFPVAMQTSDRYGILFMLTKMGYLHLFDLETGTTIYMVRISANTIFVTAPHTSSNGIIGVNRNGQVLLITIDEANLVPYINNVLKNNEVALKIASRCNLPGADTLFVERFNRLLSEGQYKEAAKVVLEAPAGTLRTSQTVQRFQNLPPMPGTQLTPVLQYFGVLLEHGKLNKIESLELARIVLSQGKLNLLEKWMSEDKLDCSEELGDMVRPYDLKTAMQIYYRAEVKQKVVSCLADSGQYSKIIAYCDKFNYRPDWTLLLHNIINTTTQNPQEAVTFVTSLLNAQNGPLVDVNTIVDVFMSRTMVQEVTSILFDYLKGNKPEDASLQTRLLEINLLHAPQVADALLGNEMFTHYDRIHVAKLCERAGLFQRALEHYTELSDIKRVLANSSTAINSEFLANFLGHLSPDDSIECMKLLLRANLRQNLQLVVSVAIKSSDQIAPEALIELFESFKSYDGLFFYLGKIVNYSQNPEVHFKYIEAAAKTGQIQEVERICRESNYYDPERTKNFLKDARLPDQKPFIIVCDRFDFISDMTRYLYHNSMFKYIEAYVQKINPANAAQVIGTLLDLECAEDYIRQLILSVRNVPVEELVEQVEKRNRLKILLPWLEARVNEGNTEPATHNALSKIYIDAGKDPERFLLSNQYYDSRVVGKYCENRDPHLAFVAYKRGYCDKELVEVTNKNGLFKNQARYIVERQDLTLWESVLSEENPYRRSLIGQVTQHVIPEAKSSEEVSTTVKAFMNAKLAVELIELLEKLVLERTEFSGNKSLQNLLILTAIKADHGRVMDYINRLDGYDPTDIATIAISAELFEEAFVIFRKFKFNVQAIDVLIDPTQLNNIERAFEFAHKCNEEAVFSKLGKAQLDRGLIKESIDSFIRANDPEFYPEVIAGAKEANLFDDLVRFLQMCRRKPLKEPIIESELIYSYAKTARLSDLEEFIMSPNCAQIQQIGDRCFNEGLYEAARSLFDNISNFSRLASTYVKLGKFHFAVEAARKAGSIRTWKEVNLACVEAREFRFAQSCGLNIIVHGDELEELIRNYESRGYYEEVIQLLEAGLGSDNAHVGMFTELAILYSKYRPNALMKHLRTYHTRLNVPKVIKVCEKYEQWPELTYLYINYDEHDHAALTMINHSVEAWENELFKEVIVKAANIEIYYKAIHFYLDEHPLLINELLSVLSPRIDHSRAVQVVKKRDRLALIKPYLISVQQNNVKAVNEALHLLYIEEEDYESLRKSIEVYEAYDSIELAKELETHELLEFRRIAAALYKKNQRWQASIELSKRDGAWVDAMQTSAASHDRELCENLLRFFVQDKRPDCFASCLYVCYDYIRPDVALELAWKNQFIDYVMPYMIQTLREFTLKVDDLTEAQKKFHKAEIESDVSIQPSIPVAPLSNEEQPTFFSPWGVPPPSLSPAVSASFFPPVQPSSFGVFPGDTSGHL